MKTKIVKMHYCEFCRKKGMSAYYMKKHELGCTLNPHRVCGMCAIISLGASADEMPPTLEQLKAVVDRTKERIQDALGSDALYAIDKKRLTEATDCPACILAVLRQTDVACEFDFAKAKQAFWSSWSEDHYRE